MKTSKRKWFILTAVVALLAAIAGIALSILGKDETLDMKDVYAIIRTVAPYLIPFVIIVLILMIVSSLMETKWSKKKISLFNWQAAIVSVLVLVITVNSIAFGPMSTIISQVFPDKVAVSEETLEASAVIAEEVANQGTVLLKNEEGLLPLASDKINVFGWASTNPSYGGTGSGGIDASTCVTLLEGLTNSGINVNTELEDFYVDYRGDRPAVSMWEQDWTLPEPLAQSYSDELLSNAKDFSDTALIVIARVGGEGSDVPIDVSKVTYEGNEGDFKDGDHYLQLSASERDMVELVTENFENVVVLYNGANAIELGWVNDYDSIKSVLWSAGPGQEGFNALGKIVAGQLNPSGRTVDTFVKDLTKTPTWNNFGTYAYDNAEGYHFINYVEGIYVGYHFYETFFLNNEEGYQEEVLYPFGYGLSYSEFEQTMGQLSADEMGNINVDVTVTNTGDVSGKEVVQLYYTAPYTEGGIEKSAIALIDFAKTKELNPGDSETISFSFNEEEMASYDTYGEESYVLEKGPYEIKLMKNAHELIDAKQYNVGSKVVYKGDNKRISDQVVSQNQFEDFTNGDVAYLSRQNNFENYEEATKAPENYSISSHALEGLTNNSNYEIVNDDSDLMPVTGAKNGLKLYDLLGKDYEDPMWDDLLDQLKVEEMKDLIALGGYQTMAIDSVGKLAATDADGPAGFSSFFNEVIKGTPFPGATMLAATWNKELAYQRGISMAKEGKELNVSGWYAPAMNIHRSAFAGRNFEYYSEDPVISGKMAAQETKGAQENGLYVFIKHFALNDQEEKRTDMLCTWSNEQAIRQIYLKPFEDAVKEGGATGAMSSFNYIGNKWAGGSEELLNNVLRDEWGFRGMVITDYFGGYEFMDADKGIRNGNDLMLSPNGHEDAFVSDTTSATGIKAMRTAAHNIMYTVVNSNAYDDYTEGVQLKTWMKFAIGMDVALILLLIGGQVLVVAQYRKKEDEVL